MDLLERDFGLSGIVIIRDTAGSYAPPCKARFRFFHGDNLAPAPSHVQRATLSSRLHAEAISAAGKIAAFLDDITDQLQWTVQLPWRDGMEERHRFDVLRLMRQVPAVVEVMLVDGDGVERLHVSRVDPDVVDSRIDRANDPDVLGACSDRI